MTRDELLDKFDDKIQCNEDLSQHVDEVLKANIKGCTANVFFCCIGYCIFMFIFYKSFDEVLSIVLTIFCLYKIHESFEYRRMLKNNYSVYNSHKSYVSKKLEQYRKINKDEVTNEILKMHITRLDEMKKELRSFYRY